MMQRVAEAAAAGRPPPQPCLTGIITPYREQCRKLRQAFEEVLGKDIASEVKIDTVDSFQGKQVQVVIFSCVRAAASESTRNARALLGVPPPSRASPSIAACGILPLCTVHSAAIPCAGQYAAPAIPGCLLHRANGIRNARGDMEKSLITA